jgi:ribokinase
MRTAVVGHVEWVSFVEVDHVPETGEIVHASSWAEEAGGGGAGASVQLAKLSGDTTFFTALGDDEIGHRCYERLTELGVRVETAWRNEPARRAITHVDRDGERTITVLGERHAPLAADPLPWDELASMDAIYFTAGDPGSVRLARAGRVLVATSRVSSVLAAASVQLDALVGSAADAAERFERGDIEPQPRLVVRTQGDRGGTWELAGETPRTYDAIAPGMPIRDRYGAGDCFAAGLAFGLGAGLGPEVALRVGALCGSAVITARGPYEGQLTRAELDGKLSG